MTTACKPLSQLRFDDLFDGRLQKYGVYERFFEAKSTQTHRSLTDGRNSIWVVGQPGGDVAKMTLWGTNDPSRIFEAISQGCGPIIVSEFQPEYWGVRTQKEIQIARDVEKHSEFHRELLSYIHGQANQFESNFTKPAGPENPSPLLDMMKAQIAKRLIMESSTLAAPEKSKELLTKTLMELEDFCRTLAQANYDYESYDQHTRPVRERATEDAEEGPLDDGYIFQINRHGVIVAVERDGSRKKTNRRQPQPEDEIPF